MLKLLIKLSALLLLPSVAHATLQYDVQDILVNLSKILDPAMVMLLSVSFISGIVMILRGLLMLKSFSMPLTQATKPGEISGPLLYIFVGTILVYIPSSTDILSSTLFGVGVNSIFPNRPTGAGNTSTFQPSLESMGQASTQIMGYFTGSIESQWATLIDTIVLYMQFIGFLAFLRAWYIVASDVKTRAQPGSISKVIVHIVGGILAINFLPLVNAVQNTIVGTG